MTNTSGESTRIFFTAYIGLGSNLAQPEAQINSALNTLANISNCRGLRSSHWYSSKAIGPGEQPDYINAVAVLETQLTPTELLHQLQNVENEHGRQRNIRWGARTLDLDLLIYSNVHIDSDELTLPHPEMMNRNFVLYPLYDVAPELTLPNGDSLHQIINNTPMKNLHRIKKHAAINSADTSPKTNVKKEPS